MADIDDFKRLNDEFGHLLGDEVLRQISSLFHQQLRKIDVVCRYGGEEFAIRLTHTNAKQAAVIALQEAQIKTLTAALKEQATQIQKVSAQLEMVRPAPRVVGNQ